MNESTQNKIGSLNVTALVRSGVLALVLTAGMIGMSASSASFAQSTSGSIIGHAPAGDTIVVEGAGGTHRHATPR